MPSKVTGPSNIQKRMLARKLWKTKRPIWRDVSKYLTAPQKNRVEKNLGDLHNVTKDGDVVIVPGKVLATGSLSKKITIAYYSISNSAASKLDASKIKRISIEQLLEENPTGSGVRIII